MPSPDVTVRGRPAFAHLVARLFPGVRIVAESGAMASMSGNVVLQADWNGGVVNALLLKFFAKESLFVNRIGVDSGQGEVVLTQSTPGDIAQVELNGETLYLTAGSFIACTEGVQLSVGWAGLASWLGGEGLFRLKVSGAGTVWFGGYGSVSAVDVSQGLIVDTGHLVAYDPTVALKTRLSGGIFSSFFSGEGLVMEIHGAGRVFLQSRNLDGLTAWVNSHLYRRN